jgi:hypothetical protein
MLSDVSSHLTFHLHNSKASFSTHLRTIHTSLSSPSFKMLTNILIILALAAGAIAAPTFETRDTPDLSQVTIDKLTTSGSGCPQGIVGQFLSDDRRT